MKIRLLPAALACLGLGAATLTHAQGFVFGTTPPKPPAQQQSAAPSGERDAKTETAQRLLARLGLLKEKPSGVMTPATREAIQSFAAQQGLPAATQANDALLNTLRRVIWQSQNYASGGYKGREKIVDAGGLREAQQLLTRLGYNPGPVDGTFGPQTQVATEAFQESVNTTVDGLVTPTVLMNLRRAVNGVGSSARESVRVMNWPDYIDPGVLLDFERETKIRVIYDIFSGNDDLADRLAGGGPRYDVVFPTANTVPGLAAKGLLAKLDKGALKNAGNIDPRVEAALRTWDKDAAYSVPYMWYTVGIAWNPRLTQRVAPGQAMDSLANIFDPAQAGRFAACGVGVVDSATDIVPLAALYGGSKWEGKASAQAAGKVLSRVAGTVKVIPTDQFVSALAEGKYCVALGFSGDAVQAQGRAKGSIEYRVPSDGGLLAIDAMAVPASAPNPKAAHAFIDYLMRPQVIAKISNTVGYANANLKAGEFMSESVRNNPAVVPSPEALSHSLPIPILSDGDQQDIQRIWAGFAR